MPQPNHGFRYLGILARGAPSGPPLLPVVTSQARVAQGLSPVNPSAIGLRPDQAVSTRSERPATECHAVHALFSPVQRLARKSEPESAHSPAGNAVHKSTRATRK